MLAGCRYFLVPFVMLALHMQPMGARQLALTAAVYTAINAATIYLFLFQPWHLADGSLARLMW
jgi:alpha-1,2-glucosyltransferase